MSAATKVLSVEDVRALLVRAVEEKGADYVYPSEITNLSGYCRYVHDSAPSCIVGHVYHYAGVSLAELQVIEGETVDTLAPLPLSSVARLALASAQAEQDEGRSWGEALAEFDRVVAESQS